MKTVVIRAKDTSYLLALCCPTEMQAGESLRDDTSTAKLAVMQLMEAGLAASKPPTATSRDTKAAGEKIPSICR